MDRQVILSASLDNEKAINLLRRLSLIKSRINCEQVLLEQGQNQNKEDERMSTGIFGLLFARADVA